MSSETTYIDEADIHQCNHCGAFHKDVDKIKHFKTCNPSECKRLAAMEEEAQTDGE